MGIANFIMMLVFAAGGGWVGHQLDAKGHACAGSGVLLGLFLFSLTKDFS